MKEEFNTEVFLEDFSSKCQCVQRKHFRKNQEITTYIQKRNQICILLSGEADLVRYDLNGGRVIIEHYMQMMCLERLLVLLQKTMSLL